MKIINGFEFLLFSELAPLEKETYYKKCYDFVQKLNLEYPCFETWFRGLFGEIPVLKSGREILMCRTHEQIVGIAILKNTLEEQKICTLRVDKKFQRMSIGKNLMELSFEWLKNDKPLITIHRSKRNEFQKLFRYYDFRLEEQKWSYYRLFRTELVFNGALPPKKILLSKFEIADMRESIKEFMKYNVYDKDLLIQHTVDLWKKQNGFLSVSE